MRLLESKPEKKGGMAGGTVFSIVLHSALLFLAIFATARAGISKEKKDKAEKVNFVEVKKKEEPPPPEEKKKEEPPKPKEKPKPAPKPKAPRVAKLPQLPKEVPLAPPKGFKVLPPPVSIPTNLPAIDLSKKVTSEADFSGKGVAGGSADGVKGGTGKEGDKGTEAGGREPLKETPYMEFQVEVPVQLTGGDKPDFPSSLRDGGTEGEVLAQFVVGENGRYEAGTLKILKSSHPAFTAAVKNALPGMRFSAARIGGEKVKQLVQMPFEFHLNR